MNPRKRPVTIVSFIGRPFAGKDSQAERLRDTYSGVALISTGALLRDQDLLNRSGFTPQELDYINVTREAGKNVRTEIVARLAHQAVLEKSREGNSVIIFAGYPRKRDQFDDMVKWEQEQRASGELDITPLYIHLRIDKEKANARRERRLEQEHRTDDADLTTVENRHREFQTAARPMARRIWWKSLFGKARFFTVNADQTRDEVASQLETILKPYLLEKKGEPEGQARGKESLT